MSNNSMANFKRLQVVCTKADARKIERHCKRQGVTVSGFFRKLGFDELNKLIEEKVGRRLVVFGACTGTDTHTGLPVIRHNERTWERLDAPPFKAAIQQGVDAIMSAHIVVPGLDQHASSFGWTALS